MNVNSKAVLVGCGGISSPDDIRKLAEEKVADTLVAIDKTVLLTLENVLAKVRTL